MGLRHPRGGYVLTRKRNPMAAENCTTRATPPLGAARTVPVGSVEIDWTSCEPAASLPDIYLFAYLREDGPDDQIPNGSASDLCWILVLAYAWARKCMAISAWKPCAGGRGWALPDASGRPRTGNGNSVYRRAAPANLHAGRSGSVRRLLNSTIVCMHVSAAGAPKPKDAEPARGPAGAASAPRSPAWRIDGGRLLSLRVTSGQP